MPGRIAAVALGLSAVVLAAAAPERAQCRLCERTAASEDRDAAKGPISLEIEASLDFDRLILLSEGEGTATLLPDGSRSVSGVIGAIGGRAMVGRVSVRGEPGRAVRIDLPRRIELHSLSGARIVIDGLVSDLSSMPRLDGGGGLSFRFGGRLRVQGDAEGEYRGDVPITVEYL
ncbi:MAG: DUF4402 domain-containing protein [Pseudomonadota bacterium]|nr:DUF4402 domain-containing protein [Pseudomonadota bacterium]